MIDERLFNLLRDQLSTAQTEKVALYTQITSLTAEIRMLRDENKRYRTEDKSSNQQLQSTLSLVKAQLESTLQTIELLNQELAKERDRNSNNNRKTYCRTSEQARLLNNRNVDERSKEKDNFDGDSVETSNDATSTESPSTDTKIEEILSSNE